MTAEARTMSRAEWRRLHHLRRRYRRRVYAQRLVLPSVAQMQRITNEVAQAFVATRAFASRPRRRRWWRFWRSL